MNKITLIIGPMKSGKSKTALLKVKEKKIKTVYITKDKKTRNDFISRSPDVEDVEVKMFSYKKQNLNSLMSELKNFNNIIIDEAQFFKTKEILLILSVAKKLESRLYICGLDSDINKKPWKTIGEIIPYVDNIIKLRANCDNCGKKDSAKFTFLKKNIFYKRVQLEGNYLSLCEKCYEKAKK